MEKFIVVACCILLFSNCFDPAPSKNTTKETAVSIYIEQGQKIARMTFATLSSNLQKAMKEGGVSNAIKYCNIAASPLVDSLTQLHKVGIKRTSLKIRNPNNRPTEKERAQLLDYQQQFDAGQALKPIVQKKNNQIAFYAPIHVMPLCGKCHGQLEKELVEKDYETIQELYPLDKAINYNSGDLRGMWSITFYE
ncbi:MAG: DUF3365 domain-containing protein [Saprospiraceae bacterium]